ncbi:MAG: terminase small subunit [Rhizomicrobium sp.]
MNDPTKLTPKQQCFVDEYLVSFNGTQAAIKAGYSVKTARAIASENSRKPAIAAAIARRSQALSNRAARYREQFVAEAARIAFADPSGIRGPDGEIRNPDDWPAETWDAIQSVRYSEKLSSGCKPKRVSYRADIRMKDKLKALDILARYLGMYETKGR